MLLFDERPRSAKTGGCAKDVLISGQRVGRAAAREPQRESRQPRGFYGGGSKTLGLAQSSDSYASRYPRRPDAALLY